MPRLEITSGPQSGETFALSTDRSDFVIGRSLDNPVVLLDLNASRCHAKVVPSGDDYLVEDMGSSNGTLLNDEIIEAAVKLRDGDEIKVGATCLRFVESDSAGVGKDKFSLLEKTLAEDLGASIVQMVDSEARSLPDLVLDDIGPEESIALQDDKSEAFQQTLKKLQILYKISEDIGTVLDLEEVLEKIMDSIFEVFPQADRGFIMMEDEQTGEIIPKVIRKRNAARDEQIKVTVSRTIIETAFREKKSILSTDAMDDDRFSDGMSIVSYGIRSMMCSPLFVGDEKLGVIHIDTQNQRERFTPDDLSMLQGIGRQAAISIKNASLVNAIEDETRKRNSLQRFLSPDIADRVMTGEIDLKLGGDEKYGTIFFSDIIGFTRMSSTLSPEVVMARINRYFNRMIGIIFEYNGTINKFWGDAIMALWGLMSDRDDYSSQVSAVEACIDMQNALFDFNYALIEEGQSPVWMGMGLNTGSFLAGNVGSEQQMEYTVIGDNVNMASRIESRASRGQIYISDTTFERVKDFVYAIKMDPTHVKGREESIVIYSIRGFQDRTHRDKEFDRLTIPGSFTDSDGVKHNGLLTGFASEEGGKRIFAHFRQQFDEGTPMAIDLDLPEISDPGTLHCQVENSMVINTEENVTFLNYELKLAESSDFFAAITGNKTVDATVPVDEIHRA